MTKAYLTLRAFINKHISDDLANYSAALAALEEIQIDGRRNLGFVARYRRSHDGVVRSDSAGDDCACTCSICSDVRKEGDAPRPCIPTHQIQERSDAPAAQIIHKPKLCLECECLQTLPVDLQVCSCRCHPIDREQPTAVASDSDPWPECPNCANPPHDGECSRKQSTAQVLVGSGLPPACIAIGTGIAGDAQLPQSPTRESVSCDTGTQDDEIAPEIVAAIPSALDKWEAAQKPVPAGVSAYSIAEGKAQEEGLENPPERPARKALEAVVAKMRVTKAVQGEEFKTVGYDAVAALDTPCLCEELRAENKRLRETVANAEDANRTWRQSWSAALLGLVRERLERGRTGKQLHLLELADAVVTACDELRAENEQLESARASYQAGSVKNRAERDKAIQEKRALDGWCIAAKIEIEKLRSDLAVEKATLEKVKAEHDEATRTRGLAQSEASGLRKILGELESKYTAALATERALRDLAQEASNRDLEAAFHKEGK